MRKGSGTFNLPADTIKVLTMHARKGLEFPVVALVGAGRLPAEGEEEREEARLFYVGATRAMQRLVIGASGGGKFDFAKTKVCIIGNGDCDWVSAALALLFVLRRQNGFPVVVPRLKGEWFLIS